MSVFSNEVESKDISNQKASIGKLDVLDYELSETGELMGDGTHSHFKLSDGERERMHRHATPPKYVPDDVETDAGADSSDSKPLHSLTMEEVVRLFYNIGIPNCQSLIYENVIAGELLQEIDTFTEFNDVGLPTSILPIPRAKMLLKKLLVFQKSGVPLRLLIDSDSQVQLDRSDRMGQSTYGGRITPTSSNTDLESSHKSSEARPISNESINEILSDNANTRNVEGREERLSSGSYEHTCIQALYGEHDGWIACLAIAPNKDIFSGSIDKTICQWRIDADYSFDVVHIFRGHSSWVTCLIVLDDARLLSGSADNTLKIWSISSGSQITTLLGHTNYIRCALRWSDNTVISAGGDCVLRLWGLSEGRLLRTIAGAEGSVECMAVVGSDLLVAGESAPFKIRLYRVSTGTVLQELRGHTNTVRGLAVRHGLTDELASVSADGSLRIWTNTASMKHQSEGRGDDDVDDFYYESQQVSYLHNSIYCVASFMDTAYVTGDYSNQLRVWSAENHFEAPVAALEGHSGAVWCVLVTSDGTVISGSDDYGVRIWDIRKI